MIPALIEGLAQAWLPCSWVIAVPAGLVGMFTTRVGPVVGYVGSVVLVTWAAVAGWLSPPLWVGGISVLAGSVTWWRWGVAAPATALLGAGTSWAWQPCVGEELARTLNVAQHDPMAALPGLAAFMVGVTVAGLAGGRLARLLERRARGTPPRRGGPLAAAILGLLMVTGLYGHIFSTLARWSTVLWK